MIKKLINTLEKLLKLEALKLIDLSLSAIKGVAIKLEFYPKDKEEKKGEKK